MKLTKEEPFAFLRGMTSELDRVFEEPWATFGPRWKGTFEPRSWMPSLEIFENDNRLVARFELPGMKKEDVHVEVSDGCLVVSGERKQGKEEKKENFYRCEREYGTFYRSVPLPDGADIADVKASISEGVLEVTVPLPAKAAPAARKVDVIEGTAKPKAA